jgi:dihydroxyacetone kinase-like predicted kinase
MNPSTEDLLAAVDRVPCEDVIVLPNNKNIIMAARQAAGLSTKDVAVVPTITVPQGIGALLALNYQADLQTNARVMEEAAKAIQTAEITSAVRSAQVNGVRVKEGEVIALVNGALTAKGMSPSEVSIEALQQMHAVDHEIITIYYGETVGGDEARALADEIATLFPDQEIELVDGGQPYYHYILSAE